MRATAKRLMLIVSVLIGLFSCSKENYESDNNDGNNENGQSEETNYLTESDLYGVWAVEGNGSDLYFMSFAETGKYSFCFNSTLMGGGSFSLDNNKLTLNNAYLNTKDELDIIKDGNNLRITGSIYKFKDSSKDSVNITVFKTNRQIPINKTGEVFKIWGLNAYYGKTVTYIKYESENLIKYQYCKDNSIKQVIREQNWFYVLNDSMTYTQNCNGEGNVVIYKLKNNLANLDTQIVKQ